MASFLCLRLHGPLASWGDIAVGQRRPTVPHPTRSAVLGLVAGALGVRRDDLDGWTMLEGSLGFASRTDSPGELLIDFHTAQGPDEKDLRKEETAARRAGVPWTRPGTRKAELAFPRGVAATLLSQREYRQDALWTVALWLEGTGPHRWSLVDLAAALRRPVFVPYLGRKSCPPDLPLEPQLVEANDPVAAMGAATFQTDALVGPVLAGGRGRRTVQWEGSWPGLVAAQTVRRRDRVLERTRWQFAERSAHERVVGDSEGATDVSQQD